MSMIKDSIFFPCPGCGAPEGYHCTEEPGCYSETQDGDPWCHSLRLQVMQFATAQQHQGLTLIRR